MDNFGEKWMKWMGKIGYVFSFRKSKAYNPKSRHHS